MFKLVRYCANSKAGVKSHSDAGDMIIGDSFHAYDPNSDDPFEKEDLFNECSSRMTKDSLRYSCYSHDSHPNHDVKTSQSLLQQTREYSCDSHRLFDLTHHDVNTSHSLRQKARNHKKHLQKPPPRASIRSQESRALTFTPRVSGHSPAVRKLVSRESKTGFSFAPSPTGVENFGFPDERSAPKIGHCSRSFSQPRKGHSLVRPSPITTASHSFSSCPAIGTHSTRSRSIPRRQLTTQVGRSNEKAQKSQFAQPASVRRASTASGWSQTTTMDTAKLSNRTKERGLSSFLDMSSKSKPYRNESDRKERYVGSQYTPSVYARENLTNTLQHKSSKSFTEQLQQHRLYQKGKQSTNIISPETSSSSSQHIFHDDASSSNRASKESGRDQRSDKSSSSSLQSFRNLTISPDKSSKDAEQEFGAGEDHCSSSPQSSKSGQGTLSTYSGEKNATFDFLSVGTHSDSEQRKSSMSLLSYNNAVASEDSSDKEIHQKSWQRSRPTACLPRSQSTPTIHCKASTTTCYTKEVQRELLREAAAKWARIPDVNRVYVHSFYDKPTPRDTVDLHFSFGPDKTINDSNQSLHINEGLFDTSTISSHKLSRFQTSKSDHCRTCSGSTGKSNQNFTRPTKTVVLDTASNCSDPSMLTMSQASCFSPASRAEDSGIPRVDAVPNARILSQSWNSSTKACTSIYHPRTASGSPIRFNQIEEVAPGVWQRRTCSSHEVARNPQSPSVKKIVEKESPYHHTNFELCESPSTLTTKTDGGAFESSMPQSWKEAGGALPGDLSPPKTLWADTVTKDTSRSRIDVPADTCTTMCLPRFDADSLQRAVSTPRSKQKTYAPLDESIELKQSLLSSKSFTSSDSWGHDFPEAYTHHGAQFEH